MCVLQKNFSFWALLFGKEQKGVFEKGGLLCEVLFKEVPDWEFEYPMLLFFIFGIYGGEGWVLFYIHGDSLLFSFFGVFNFDFRSTEGCNW